MQPIRFELRGVLREQNSVCRQGNILNTIDRGQLAYELGEVWPQQWLATREAHFAHTKLHEQPCEARNFLEGEAL
jgi:hypothetical protein